MDYLQPSLYLGVGGPYESDLASTLVDLTTSLVECKEFIKHGETE